MRRKKHPEHVNHERWLVSYADFITLLFAFFVVMFAVSQVDAKRVGRFTEAFSKAVGIEVFPLSGSGLLAGTELSVSPNESHDDAPTSVLPQELQDLEGALVEAAKRDDTLTGLQIVERRNELVLRLPEKVLFDSGDDTVKPVATKMIAALAPKLASRRVEVRVEGHTDDRPISNYRFPSNWELSTGRATAVLVCLAKGGLDMKRLSAAGYAEFRPIAPNDTEEGRKQNRRVDLIVTVMPADGT